MSSEANEETKEAEKPKSSKMLIIIIAVVVVLLGAGGVVGYLKFFKAEPTAPAHKEAAVEAPVYQDIETFLVNLADPGGKRYLKITMKARLSSPATAAEWTTRVFEMRDIILMLLSSKEYEDISKPEDKTTLKQEIISLLNRALQKGQVQDIYFTEFLIQ